MNIFEGQSWSIELQDGWVGEHEEDCSTIYHPDGVGALQISAYTKDSEVTDEDLRDHAQDHIQAGAKLAASQFGEFKGYTLAFGVDDEFWQHWYVRAGCTLLFLTYNCAQEDRQRENDVVKTMVASMKTT